MQLKISGQTFPSVLIKLNLSIFLILSKQKLNYFYYHKQMQIVLSTFT